MVLTHVLSVKDSTFLLEQKNPSANSLINTNKYTQIPSSKSLLKMQSPNEN